MLKKLRLVLFILAALAIIAAGIVYWMGRTQPQQTADVLGGDFTLVNQDNRIVGDAYLDGRYRLIFFGFTNCPMMCPMAMGTISTVMKRLPQQQQAQIAPLLITVDPERDTPAVLKEYLANFHPSIQGLTGSQEEIDKAATLYRVHKQAETPDASGNYEVNHTGTIYLMDKNGSFLRFFPHDVAPAELEEALKATMKGN